MEAPPGYQLLTECAFVGELPTEDLTITLTVHNSPGYALPTTGGSGFRWLPLSALLLALAGAFFIPKIKKKDESI